MRQGSYTLISFRDSVADAVRPVPGGMPKHWELKVVASRKKSKSYVTA
jgi:hypothetical protein